MNYSFMWTCLNFSKILNFICFISQYACGNIINQESLCHWPLPSRYSSAGGSGEGEAREAGDKVVMWHMVPPVLPPLLLPPQNNRC